MSSVSITETGFGAHVSARVGDECVVQYGHDRSIAVIDSIREDGVYVTLLNGWRGFYEWSELDVVRPEDEL